MAGTALAWLLADERIAQVVVGPGRPEHLEPVREALERPARRGRTPADHGDLQLMLVLILSNDEIHAALSPADVRAGDGGRARRPRPRRGVHAAALGDDPARAPPGFIGLMPAYVSASAPAEGRGYAGAAFALKAICLIPGNPARGLDAHQGIVTLFDGETGVPTAILNASAVTEIRTAAVTAVATRALAREDAARARDPRRRGPGALAPRRAARRAAVRRGPRLRADRRAHAGRSSTARPDGAR